MSPLLHLSPSSRLSSERFRYQEPKRFWIALFAGSLGLHLAAALLAPAVWRSFSPESSGTGSAPTPVELIDASELGGVALNDAATPSDASIAGAPTAAETPAIADPVPQPAPAANPQPVPQPVTPQPNPSFSDVAPVSPQPPADFSNRPDPTPLPQQPLPNQNTPTQQPQPSQDVPSGLPQTGPPVVTGQPLPPPGTVPNPSDYDGSTGASGGDADATSGEGNGTSDNLPGVGTPQQATPSRGVASLTPGNATLSGATADAPEVPPQPLQTSLEFTSDPTEPNSCLITPDSVASFGETISFNLVISTEGRVVEVYDDQVSSNSAYTELGRCLVRNWTFTPAQTGDTQQQSNLVVTLSIEPAP